MQRVQGCDDLGRGNVGGLASAMQGAMGDAPWPPARGVGAAEQGDGGSAQPGGQM